MTKQERLCLSYNPFQGDETDVTELSDKFVTTRYSHKCQICFEQIAAKSHVRARREVNNEDKKVMTFYFCEECCGAMARSWRDEGRSISERTSIGMRAAGAL